VGIAYDTHGESWSLALGLFGEGLDDGDDNDVGDEGWGGGFRATYAPIAGARRALHLGLAANYRTYGANPDYEDSRLRLRSRPESHVADTWLLDTDNDLVAVDAATRLGLEAAAVLGAFSLQGEYLQAHVARGDGQADLLFDGYYAYASWFLTGESRNYDVRHGEFNRIRPLRNFGHGGPGAWEFGLRYSALDLEDEDIEGGVAQNFTLGVNWYLNPQLRLMANYIWVDTEPDVFGNDNDPRILQLRAQYDF
jgi:phosphate-selective porin OprO/OprP